jgi:hypothetical protein
VASGAGWEATVPSNATAGRHVYIGNVGGTSMTVEGESSPEIIIDRFSSGQPIPKISAR